MSKNEIIRLIETFNVPDLNQRVRLSDFAPGKFRKITSKKGVKNAIKKGLIKVNGNPGYTGDFLSGGEVLELFQSTEPENRPGIDLKLDVLFEDDYLAIVNKPAGIIVSGNKKWTLENALSYNLEKSKQADALQNPEPIHRLDYPTSGALLIGKTVDMVIKLNKLFEERKIEKVYVAITVGEMEKQGQMNFDVDNKKAITDYIVENSVISERFKFLNLVKLFPHTGRRHQLRIQLAELGNQILGDREHGREELILKGKGLYLHSLSLKFIHPITESEIYVESPLPKKYLKIFPRP